MTLKELSLAISITNGNIKEIKIIEMLSLSESKTLQTYLSEEALFIDSFENQLFKRNVKWINISDDSIVIRVI